MTISQRNNDKTSKQNIYIKNSESPVPDTRNKHMNYAHELMSDHTV